MAGLQGFQDLRVRKVTAAGIAGRQVAVEHEGRPGLEHHGALHEGAKPELRTLQINQDADRMLGLALDRPDRLDLLGQLLAREMAHVEPEYVHARPEQAFDHLRRVRGRPEGGDDLCTARAFQA